MTKTQLKSLYALTDQDIEQYEQELLLQSDAEIELTLQTLDIQEKTYYVFRRKNNFRNSDFL